MSQPITRWGEADSFRWELTNQIAAILHANGTGVRPFYSHITNIPRGGVQQLINEVPFDGVRAEIGGTTVSIEITNVRNGDVSSDGSLRFSTYDIVAFREWFYSLLSRLGIQPAPVGAFNLLRGYAKPQEYEKQRIRPSLTPIRRTKKGKK